MRGKVTIGRNSPSLPRAGQAAGRPALFAIGALLLAHLATAQEPPPSVFGEIVEVRVVNLEVVVEDLEGRRVRGLSPSDFTLRIDGEETPIDYFTEIFDGSASPPPSAIDPRGVEGRTVTRQRAAPVGTNYLLFLDEYFSARFDLDAVLDGIFDSVARLGPNDRMAVVAYNGESLDMLSSWSGSPADLQRVIERAKDRPSRGRITAIRMNELALAGEYEERLERVVVATTSTLRSFANPPGRKVLLLTSGGWPDLGSERLLGTRYLVDAKLGHRYLERLYETANLLGYTIYPIDSSRGGARIGRDASGSTPVAGSLEDRDSLRNTLQILARTTGGEVVARSVRQAALERAIDDTRSYYWLGFTPDWRGDDANRAIDVEIRQPGLRIRHRAGFEDMSRAKEVGFMVEGALMVGHLPGSQPLEVTVGEAVRKRRKTYLPLDVAIPLDAVTVLPIDGTYLTEVELRLAAVDENGNRSELDLIPITLRGSEPPSPGQKGRQAVTAVLRPKSRSLVVSVYDPATGTILASVIELGALR